MLTSLRISNIVLIDKLNLEFSSGLNILTGETGAGKSILMDALSLALGERSDTGLIRHGCDTASVVAEFDAADANVLQILRDSGIDFDGTIILRRTLGIDGKSRAWVNDIPVSVKTLKSVGDALVEVHGQFANHALLNPGQHRVSLDNFASKNISGFDAVLNDVHKTYREYNAATVKLNEIKSLLERSELEREYLEHNVSELKNLNVQPGEEDDLAGKRADMMNMEKNAAILKEAVEVLGHGGNSLESQIYSAAHILERIKTEPNPYSEQIDALYNAAETISEATQRLTVGEVDTDTLESIEERLFAIRAAARKHHVLSDELPAKLIEMETQLNTINNSDAELKKLQSVVANAKKEYEIVTKKLTEMRKLASDELCKRITQELPDLKLANASFMVQITPTVESATGQDDVVYMIRTNPGMPFAPLHKSASGGELARLMLAMRVVLTDSGAAHTFVFDEIDTGISGATASAVGDRLNRLAHDSQAIVITHSAQVAGYADKHFKIEKNSTDGTTTTNVREISADERLNEIARIISGAEITPESLTTAKTLIK
ncbi:MAG: DNA repair protein RecN [Alphaproteobacteria bacterium]|nr:DNA repair protein RecN [Alphaproteobacteria bacterium]